MDRKKRDAAFGYLRRNQHEGGASGFILPDGEWVPIRRHEHDWMTLAAIHYAGDTGPWSPLTYFRDGYGVIRVTYFPGMIGFDAPDAVTDRQIETAATRVVATARGDDIIGWDKEPGTKRGSPEAEYHERCLTRVEKLSGRCRLFVGTVHAGPA